MFTFFAFDRWGYSIFKVFLLVEQGGGGGRLVRVMSRVLGNGGPCLFREISRPYGITANLYFHATLYISYSFLWCYQLFYQLLSYIFGDLELFICEF